MNDSESAAQKNLAQSQVALIESGKKYATARKKADDDLFHVFFWFIVTGFMVVIFWGDMGNAGWFGVGASTAMVVSSTIEWVTSFRAILKVGQERDQALNSNLQAFGSYVVSLKKESK